jgi:hypothetical protein
VGPVVMLYYAAPTLKNYSPGKLNCIRKYLFKIRSDFVQNVVEYAFYTNIWPIDARHPDLSDLSNVILYMFPR